jgi:CheY-like chemotaxis protein
VDECSKQGRNGQRDALPPADPFVQGEEQPPDLRRALLPVHEAFPLLVHDDGDILDLLAEVLRSGGVQVNTTEGTDDALQAIQGDFLPEVVLTDIMMPGRSCEDPIDDLRKNPATHDPSIGAMAASRASLTHVRSQANGNSAKPVSLRAMDVILAVVS